MQPAVVRPDMTAVGTNGAAGMAGILNNPNTVGTGALASPTPVPQATPQATAMGTGVGGTGLNFNSPQYLNGIRQEYETTIGNAQQLIPFYQNQQQAATNIANTQASNQITGENNNYTSQNGILGTQRQANTNQQNLSLAQLADQIRGQNQALQSQLGSLGAGFSSAHDMGEFALAKQQNTSRASIQQQAGNNDAVIQANQQALLTQHNSNLAAIDDWKKTQLNNIIGYYTPLIANLNQQIGNAQGEEKARLALYGQNLAAEAQNALTQLDTSIKQATKSATNNLIQQLPQLGTVTAQPAPNPIQAPAISPFTAQLNGAGNTTAAPTGGSLAALRLQNI